MTKAIALIPARSGSKRVPGKNIRKLGRHPLIAYSISAAIQSELFDTVLVSTDSEEYAAIARHYGAESPFMRPTGIAGSKSPDIEWLEYTLSNLASQGREFELFSLLRPTSPFRTADTIRRAWHQFIEFERADSLRAVELCKEHPGKMWVLRGEIMYPFMPLTPADQPPWHSSQYASLPEVYIQNASLEIARSSVIKQTGTISGQVVVPFLTEGFEGFDINNEEDWILAEHYIKNGEAVLPVISCSPYKG